MRAISLWQPWATAIAIGVKLIETRHWSTGYRGPLAIHAAKIWTRDQREFAANEHALGRLPKRIPLGALVARCELTDCLPSEEAVLYVSAREKIYGNFEPHRFAWVLANVHALSEPIPFIGRQGFFDVPNKLFPWYCEKGEAAGVVVCMECASISAGYQAAMGGHS